jgi:hypothetical protein
MQMPLDLRSKANDALDQARMLVESGDEAQIRHGCLELRFCIEYLILDRFRWYQEYIDDEAAKKWTPKKVIEELLENDPHADTTAQIAVGIEKEYGVPSDDMHVLGTDHRLRLKWANSNWNALGNFLHAPSLDQLTSGAVPSLPVMKARAGDIIAHLTKVLATPVWNVSGGEIFELKCEDCGIITKRFAAKVEKDQSLTCKTPDCGAKRFSEFVRNLSSVPSANTKRSFERTLSRQETRLFARSATHVGDCFKVFLRKKSLTLRR